MVAFIPEAYAHCVSANQLQDYVTLNIVGVEYNKISHFYPIFLQLTQIFLEVKAQPFMILLFGDDINRNPGPLLENFLVLENRNMPQHHID